MLGNQSHTIAAVMTKMEPGTAPLNFPEDVDEHDSSASIVNKHTRHLIIMKAKREVRGFYAAATVPCFADEWFLSDMTTYGRAQEFARQRIALSEHYLAIRHANGVWVHSINNLGVVKMNIDKTEAPGTHIAFMGDTFLKLDAELNNASIKCYCQYDEPRRRVSAEVVTHNLLRERRDMPRTTRWNMV